MMTESFQVTPDQLNRIRDLAYEKYVARGGEDGHDLEDWVSAEQEVLGCGAEAIDSFGLESGCRSQSCSSSMPIQELAAV